MGDRLTLSWVNKDKALMPDGDGGYEWVERDDPRVTEVRLLHQGDRVGEVADTADDNLLIQGDSYDALHALAKTPEYAKRFRGKVKLIYIDPPFNTGQAFQHYDDALEHSVWLGMMRERLLLIRELLAPDGSVWVHLDSSEVAYCRILMDEIFGRGNFAGEVIWRSTDNSNNDAKTFSADHNTILVFGGSSGWLSKSLPPDENKSSHYKNPDNDPRGPWFDGNPLGSPNPRENLRFNLTSPQGHVIKPPPNGWRWSRETLQEKIDSGEIRFTSDGRGIRRRTYLWEQGGLPPSSLWSDIDETASNRRAKTELKRLFPGRPTSSLFKTPKPEKLVRKILQIATDPGDIVLDCFAGSGATAATAHKMRRKWVTVELSAETVDTFTKPRLEKVVYGDDLGGVTKDVNWSSGGGFRVLTVGPSLYERVGTRVLLSDWAKGAEFGQAVAAQLGFRFEPDGPFVGAKGRSRLAVVDGIADDVVVSSIVSYLEDDERVVVVAKGAAPGTEQVLRELSTGSRLLKAPTDLVRRGRVVR